MPSIFRNVIKSRRKKKKTRGTAPVNIGSDVSSSHHDFYTTRKNQPQQQMPARVSRISDDGCDETTESLNDHHHQQHTPKDIHPHGKRNFFKSLRRKSKRDMEYDTNAGSTTPDTVASSNGLTPNPQSSSSSHDRRSLQESHALRQRSRSLDESHCHSRDNNRIEDVTSSKADSAGSKPQPLELKFKQKENNDEHHQTTTNSGKRFSGNTKTVIMNGDIVVSKSYTSKSSSDTATVTSTASSRSKAKAMRREAERNARAASALDEKGNDLFEKGYFDKAMACYTKALKLKRRTFAHLLEETDDLEEELMLRDESGNLADPQALVSMATSINNIGYLRQRSGDATPEETMAAYKKSLRIKRRILGNDSLSVGKTLNNIGSVHYLKRELDHALSAYDEALEIMKANLGEKHPDVATVMSNIGDVYLAQDNKETSIKYYRLALCIRWEAFGNHSPRVVRLLEKISNLEIGDLNSKMASQKTLWGDDGASDVMVGSDFQPVSEALRLLQEQVRNDIEQVDQMERDAAVETLKDKIIIIRGMRDCTSGSGPELLDNDSASVQTAMSRISGR